MYRCLHLNVYVYIHTYEYLKNKLSITLSRQLRAHGAHFHFGRFRVLCRFAPDFLSMPKMIERHFTEQCMRKMRETSHILTDFLVSLEFLFAIRQFFGELTFYLCFLKALRRNIFPPKQSTSNVDRVTIDLIE